MIVPGKEEFINLSKSFNRITVYREIEGDSITPVILLKMFENEEELFLFESANLDKTFSRFSFFGFNPDKIHKTSSLNENENFDFLEDLSKNEKPYLNPNFGDFSGGLVGFFSYEAVNKMKVLRRPMEIREDFFDSVFFEVNKFYVFDNHHFRLYAAVSVSISENPSKIYEYANDETKKMEDLLFVKANANNGFKNNNFDFKEPVPKMEMKKSEFVEKVKYLKKQIENGEGIQVVLSNKFEVEGNYSPLDFYRSLRRINPSPYMFFIKFNNKVICGSSPETHLKVTGVKALLKPIAGTYALRNEDDFQFLSEKIKKDEKEMAEHLMLLDLARNDLSTLCRPGSVKVLKSFDVERYSHLIHLVSEVVGELKDKGDTFGLFCKTFPAGTVSGAPKVRAMELINKLEPSDRGFYAGCVGYFGYDGSLDTCITIRTALFEKSKVIFRAGAGIVFDSNPESEFLEVNRKLEALFSALRNSVKQGV